MDTLKPFLMLACVAFVVGFMGYLAVFRLATTPDAPAPESYAAAADGGQQQTVAPAPADDAFDPGKII